MGSLETTLMEILWATKPSSVHEVAARLERPLAYTTVMTTLDRLYKKGLLKRRKVERAFVYAPAMTRAEWELKRVSVFLSESRSELLISCLVDAVGEHDAALLDELERKIRNKRRELGRS